jgi:hypothetical protein
MTREKWRMNIRGTASKLYGSGKSSPLLAAPVVRFNLARN